jgi:cyclic pyranopterin phosphate synthase
MKDCFGRTINYLRVSVTDRCNLRCEYCRPALEPQMNTDEHRYETNGLATGDASCSFVPSDVLSYEEIAEVVRAAGGMGVNKVRLTGGEPLVRRELPALVALLAAIPAIRDLSMTTNGILLAGHARALARAGLQRVNVSLDTVDPESFRRLTGGELRRVLDGIAAAQAAGLNPVKLNCVVAHSWDEPDARGVARFAGENGLEVRFIRRMDLRAGTFSVVQGGSGGDCPRCNRLRLSCTGLVRPCLFSDLGFSVREFGARGALERAVQAKPRCGKSCSLASVGAIGG